MHSHASSFALSEGAGSSVDVILPQPDHHQYSDRKQNTLNENELLFDLNSSNCKSETDDQYDEDELMYVLRRKPKRSRRFEDQDFTNENQEPLPSKSINVDGDDPEPARRTMPAASFNKKPMFTCKLQDKPPPACTECGKEFNSWKALFGHMRCHPEREWRGIQPPAEHLSSMRAHKDSMARNGASESNRYIVVKPLQASKQEMLRRKEMVNQLRSSQSASFSHDVTKAANHSQSREDGLADEYTILGSIRGDEKLRWSLCRKQVMLEEEEESDTESIEAAYMSNNKDEEDKCLHLLASFSRGKRSKRSHFTVKSLRSVQDKLAAKVVEMEPQDEDLEMANCLVMLALAGSVNIEGGNPEGGTVSKSDDDNDEDDDEGTVDDQLRLTCRSNVSCTATAVDDSKALHIQNDISVSNLDDINAGDGGKYECAACKRSFKSHQALGGHRASHKKVKGCFAKTAGDVEASSMSSKDGIATTTTYLDTSILTLAGVCKDQMVTASTTHLGTSLPDRNADCKDSIATSGTYAGTSAYGISGGHVSGRGGLNIASSAPNVAESGPAFQLLLDSIDGLTSKSSKLTLHNPSKFHQCSICQRVFSSGQALGGHKRCHWAADKADRHASEMGTGISATACVATPPTMAKLTFFARPPADEEATHQVKVLDIDLNLPAPLDVDPVNSTNAKVINTCKNNSALGSLLSLGQCSSVTIHAPIDLDDESFHSGGPNATGPHSVAEPAAYSGTSSPSSTTSTHVSEIGPCL